MTSITPTQHGPKLTEKTAVVTGKVRMLDPLRTADKHVQAVVLVLG